MSSKYRKRVDAYIPEIEAATAFEWAEHQAAFEADPPPSTTKVTVRLKGTNLQSDFSYNAEAVAQFQGLKRAGITWFEGRSWFVSWRNRRRLYAILPKADELLNKPKRPI